MNTEQLCFRLKLRRLSVFSDRNSWLVIWDWIYEVWQHICILLHRLFSCMNSWYLDCSYDVWQISLTGTVGIYDWSYDVWQYSLAYIIFLQEQLEFRLKLWWLTVFSCVDCFLVGTVGLFRFKLWRLTVFSWINCFLTEQSEFRLKLWRLTDFFDRNRLNLDWSYVIWQYSLA